MRASPEQRAAALKRLRDELAGITLDLRGLLEDERVAGDLWPRTPESERHLAPLRLPTPASEPETGAPREELPTHRAPAPALRRAPDAATVDPAAYDSLSALAEALQGCARCKLAAGRTHLVFGEGDPQARLLLVGEGPGYHEDRQGRPFVGPAGELLDKILKAIGLNREQVYICNIVKCRPPNNRDPQPDEVAACRAFVQRQIEIVRPRIVLALGRIAAQALLDSRDSLGRLRGRFHDYHGTPLMVTYHPAAILREPKYKRPTWEDVQIVASKLAADEPR